METLAITIDSKAKRFVNFLENNAHLKIIPFDAIVGKNLSKEEILKMYNGKVAKWMIPDDVILTDNIPLGATGKILKNKLRDQFGGHKIS